MLYPLSLSAFSAASARTAPCLAPFASVASQAQSADRRRVVLAMSHAELSLLRNFQMTSILSEDTHCKKLTLLGTIVGHGPAKAILEIEKTAFHAQLPAGLLGPGEGGPSTVALLYHNDIWYSFHEHQAGLKMDLTYPASPMDIAKKTLQKTTLISETPQLYARSVVPWLRDHPIERNHWIRNIMEGRSEADAIVFQDDHIVLLPDAKWDRLSTESLYLLAIFKDERLQSLRDFSATHLPLLKSVRASLAHTLLKAFGVAYTDCRVYFHYLPTFYWAHLHVQRGSASESSGNFAVGKAFLLDDVIDNIGAFDGNYYQRKTMHYHLGRNHPLYATLSEATDQ